MSKNIEINKLIEQWNQKTNLKNGKNIGEFTLKTSDFHAKIEHFCSLSGIGYCDCELVFKNDTIIADTHEDGYNFLWFNTGETINLNGDTKQEIFTKNSVLLGKTCAGFRGLAQYKSSKLYKNQCILLDEDTARELAIFSEFDDKFSAKSLKIDTQSHVLLHQLRSSYALDGRLKELFIESKILDLVYKYSVKFSLNSKKLHEIPNDEFNKKFDVNLSMNLYEKLNTKEINLNDCAEILHTNLSLKFCEHEVRAIKKAHEILLSNLQNPPTIRMLARMCAINEFKLKKGFKAMFGITIYGALQRARLETARELLTHRDINVGEAAALVGYKSLGHFSKIFRESFGVLPKNHKN